MIANHGKQPACPTGRAVFTAGDVNEGKAIGRNTPAAMRRVVMEVLLWTWKCVFKMLLNGRRKLQNSQRNVILILENTTYTRIPAKKMPAAPFLATLQNIYRIISKG